MAGDLGIDQDVLQLADVTAGQRPHPETGSPSSQLEVRTGSEMCCRTAAAAFAGPASEDQSGGCRLAGCDHFEYFIPTPGTNPTRQVDNVPAPAADDQPREGREV